MNRSAVGAPRCPAHVATSMIRAPKPPWTLEPIPKSMRRADRKALRRKRRRTSRWRCAFHAAHAASSGTWATSGWCSYGGRDQRGMPLHEGPTRLVSNPLSSFERANKAGVATNLAVEVFYPGN